MRASRESYDALMKIVGEIRRTRVIGMEAQMKDWASRIETATLDLYEQATPSPEVREQIERARKRKTEQ